MMTDLVWAIIKFNLIATAAIVAVMFLRGPIRQYFGAGAAYALWALVPMVVVASLIPARTITVLPEPLPVELRDDLRLSPPSTEFAAVDVPPSFDEIVSSPVSSIERVFVTTDLIAGMVLLLWGVGVAATILLMTVRQRRFVTRLGTLTRDTVWDTHVYRSSSAEVGPALIGVFRPRIIIPENFEQRYTPYEQELIVAHENHHRKNGDHFVNAATALASCVGWFNPLFHMAANRLRLDQELSCDAAIVNRYPSSRREYGEAMLKELLLPKTVPLGCHWQSQHPLKDRIAMLKNALPPQHQRLIGSAAVGALCIGTSTLAWAAQPATEVEAPIELLPEASVVEPEKKDSKKVEEKNDVVFEEFKGTTSQFDVKGIKITEAIAAVKVIPERRSDYSISIDGGYTPKMKTKEGKLWIVGNSKKSSNKCKADTAADVKKHKDGLMITIRAPQDGDIVAAGNVFMDVGAMNGADISVHGCGEATIADSKGPMDISGHGSVKIKMGDVNGQLDASMHGSTKLVTGDVRGTLDASLHGSSKLYTGDVGGHADMSIHGSNHSELGRIKGLLDASMHGSVTLKAKAAMSGVDASMHGSTDLNIGEVGKMIDASLHGSSEITIEEINAKSVEVNANGASDANFGRGKIDLLELDLSGSADAEFMGHAVKAVIDNNTSNNVYIEKADTLVLQRKASDYRGKVKTGNNPKTVTEQGSW